MEYGTTYKETIESTTAEIPAIVVNTPLVDERIVMARKRPAAFFCALAQSENFNNSLEHAHIVNLPYFDESLTYDAVHYTQRGNEIIFDRIRDYL